MLDFISNLILSFFGWILGISDRNTPENFYNTNPETYDKAIASRIARRIAYEYSKIPFDAKLHHILAPYKIELPHEDILDFLETLTWSDILSYILLGFFLTALYKAVAPILTKATIINSGEIYAKVYKILHEDKYDIYINSYFKILKGLNPQKTLSWRNFVKYFNDESIHTNMDVIRRILQKNPTMLYDSLPEMDKVFFIKLVQYLRSTSFDYSTGFPVPTADFWHQCIIYTSEHHPLYLQDPDVMSRIMFFVELWLIQGNILIPVL